MSFTQEEISNEFGVDGVRIEQTLTQSFDPFSGMDIDTGSFQNTNQGLEESNQDGRIELGMFSFIENNQASDSFPDVTIQPFKAITKTNLVHNGDCRFVQQIMVTSSLSYDQGASLIIQPEGNWRFLSLYDENGYHAVDFTPDTDAQGFSAYGGKYEYVPLSLEIYDGEDGFNYWAKLGAPLSFYSSFPIEDDVDFLYFAGTYNREESPYYSGQFEPTQEEQDEFGSWENLSVEYYLNSNRLDDYREKWLLYDMYVYGNNEEPKEKLIPNIASWIQTPEAYSNNRCLQFLNFQLWDQANVYQYTEPLGGSPAYIFNWLWNEGVHNNGDGTNSGTMPEERAIAANQYRTLNQAQKIYDKFNDEPINPYSSLKIKFKMKTTHCLPPFNDTSGFEQGEIDLFRTNPLNPYLGLAPQVEVGILLSQFNELPKSGKNSIGRQHKGDEYFKAPGGFNSQKYYNADTFEGRMHSGTNGLHRFQNSEIDKWEEFEFTYNLSNEHENRGFIYGVPYGGAFDDEKNNGPIEILINHRSNEDGTAPQENIGDIYFNISNQTIDGYLHFIHPDGTEIEFNTVFHNMAGDNQEYKWSVDTGLDTQTTGLQSTVGLGGKDIEAYLMWVGPTQSVMGEPGHPITGDDDGQISTNEYVKAHVIVAYWSGERWYYDDGNGFSTSNQFTPRTNDSSYPDFKCFILGRLYADGSGITAIDQYISNEAEYPTDGLGNLHLFLQTGNNFQGRVLIDDIECYESYEFTPEVDVRKKISVGEYGIADLTKYYDKDLQPEEYKDSQAPLEAQFYFYPQYPTDEIFNVTRTPIYNDFKNGKFYIYDVDWGDGSPKEFTTAPEQIGEKTALYHTYETDGVFEVTGTMIRVKTNEDGEIQGVAYNKKFNLRININEGINEDFRYFGSDGYSFIPFKNTVPIIGGISNQSSYYKKIKRQIGFLDNEKISIEFKSKSDKLKTELALLKMENQDLANLEVLPSYMRERSIFDINNYQLLPSEDGVPGWPEQNNITWTYSPTGTTTITRDLIPEGVVSIFSFELASFIYIDAITNEWQSWYDGTYYLENGKLYGFIVSVNSEPVEWPLLNDLMDEPAGRLIYNGISKIKEELGKGIGDCDLTNVKYYNKPKSISEIMFGEIDLSSEYLATLPFPQYIEEFNTVDDTISEYPLIILKDGALDTPYPQQQLSNMIIWEQETISLNDIYIPIFTLVPNGVTKILQFDTEPVSPEDSLYGAWGNQPDGEPYPVYVNRYTSAWIPEMGESGEWFGQISSLETGKRYCFILENEERMVESERDEINWYAGAPEDYIPTESEISITEEDTIYFGNIGRPDIQDYILRVLNNDSLEDSEFTFPFTDNFPSNQWPSANASVNNFADESLSDLINRKSTYVHPYYIFSNPSSIGYWKNIIPKDYSIFNREGLDGKYIDTYSEQEWLDGYYYPVLPKYNQNGEFTENDFPNDNIPFPSKGSITNEIERDENLLINMGNTKIESDVLNDNSGNKNYSFLIQDFSPKFDDETLRVEKTKQRSIFKISKRNGAF